MIASAAARVTPSSGGAPSRRAARGAARSRCEHLYARHVFLAGVSVRDDLVRALALQVDDDHLATKLNVPSCRKGGCSRRRYTNARRSSVCWTTHPTDCSNSARPCCRSTSGVDAKGLSACNQRPFAICRRRAQHVLRGTAAVRPRSGTDECGVRPHHGGPRRLSAGRACLARHRHPRSVTSSGETMTQLTRRPTPAPLTPPVAPSFPKTLADCAEGGWRNYTQFENEGECRDYVRSTTP